MNEVVLMPEMGYQTKIILQRPNALYYTECYCSVSRYFFSICMFLKNA